MSLCHLIGGSWSEQIEIENNTNNNCREIQQVRIHQNYLAHLETFGRQSEGRSSLVIMVVGRGNVGKTSFLKKILGADCETRDRAYPTTHEAKMYQQTKHEGTERAVTLHIIDTPGFGGIDNNMKKYEKELSQVTNKAADVIFYCVSMHDGGRIDSTDVSIIKAFTAAFGKGKLLLEDYAEQLQKALNRAYIFDTKVRSIFSEPHPDKSSFPAIPVGYDPQEPLPLCSSWSDNSFMKDIVARQLLELKTVDSQQVVEVFGSATVFAVAGAAVGAASETPFLSPAAGGILLGK